MSSMPQPVYCQRVSPFLLIFLLLAIVYWGSLYTGWQMDDRPNITDNPGLQIDNLMPESLWGTFFANQGKTPKLYRPLPCLSLGLNWYIGRDDPFGYHLVNIGIHIATAWILYLLLVMLLKECEDCGSGFFPDPIHGQSGHQIRKYTAKYNEEAIVNISLLAAILWAANPIQTQAVTYIVQRMAEMGAFFYVLGMLCYVHARISDKTRMKWTYGIACFACFACGVGSKENAVLLPLSLGLTEWIFFRKGSFSFLNHYKRSVLVGLVVIFSVIYLAYIAIGRNYLATGYADRPFTFMERVLTEPRIVLWYLSLIFYPAPQRLSIAHDVVLSTSLFHPWTTLPAILLVVGLIAAAVAQAERYPLASFAILFYFFNHVVESSILPLELIFEHRNYLPSLFLFLPVAAGFQAAMRRLPSISRAGMAGVMLVIIIFMGLWTHTRNNAWATSESLWRDAAIKAPGSVRPLVTLGIQLAWREHPTPADYRHALALFQRSLTLSRNRNKERAEILGNIASVYSFQNNDAKAVEIYQQAIAIDPGFYKNRSDLVKSLILAGRFEEARKQTEYLVAARPDNPDYWNLLGFILLWQGENEKALTCFQNAMKTGQPKNNLLLNIGVALTRAGYLDRGQWFLKQAIQNRFDDPVSVFMMMENRIRAGDGNAAEIYAEKLANSLPARTILDAMNALPGNYHFLPVSVAEIRPVLLDAMASVLKQTH